MNKIYPVYFTCADHFEELIVSLKHLKSIASEYIGTIHIYCDKVDFFSQNQLSHLSDCNVEKTLEPMSWGGITTVENELFGFYKISESIKDNDYILNIDSDSIVISNDIFDKMSKEKEGDIIGQKISLFFEANWDRSIKSDVIDFQQGSFYFIKAPFVKRLLEAYHQNKNEITTWVSKTCSVPLDTIPPDVTFMKIAEKANGNIKYVDFMVEKHKSVIHLELTKDDYWKNLFKCLGSSEGGTHEVIKTDVIKDNPDILWKWAFDKFNPKLILEIDGGHSGALSFYEDRDCEILGTDYRKEVVEKRAAEFSDPNTIMDLDLENQYLSPFSNYDLLWCNRQIGQIKRDNIVKTFQNSRISIALCGKKDMDDLILAMEKKRFKYREDLTLELRNIAPNNSAFKKVGIIFERTFCPIKIFGIGLMKCGTSSLYEAMNYLGFKSIQHPTTELLSHIDCFEFANDLPFCSRYKHLDKEFKGAKFIYTIRDKEDFLNSAEKQWARQKEGKTLKWLDHTKERMIEMFGTLEFDRDIFSEVYDRHDKEVREYFKDRPDNLLIMDICKGDGWDKLLPFMDIPATNVDIPFPHSNINGETENERVKS